MVVMMAFLIAESVAGSGELAPWVGVGTTLGGSAFVAGVAWYLLTKQLPAMQDRHDKALTAQQATFEKALEAQRVTNSAATAALQDAFQRAIERQQATFERAIKEQAEKSDRNEEIHRADSKAGLGAILEHCERERRALAAEVESMAQQSERMATGFEELRIDLREYGLKRNRRGKQPPPPTNPGGSTT